MPSIAGLRGTGDWGTDERPKDFREMILWLNPNGEAPITALMSKMKKETTTDPEYSWWEEEMGITRLTLNDPTHMVAGDTAVVVDEGALALVVGDHLLVENETEDATFTDEIVRVTAITNDTSFDIARGQAGTTATTINDNSNFLLLGNVSDEGSSSPGVASQNPTKQNNFCEIMKTAFEVTGTAAKTKARTGDLVKNEKKRKSFRHAVHQELKWLYGKRHENAVGPDTGKPQRYTGGLFYFAANAPGGSRITVRAAAYANVNALFDDIVDVFNYTGEGDTGGDERIVFGGNGALNIINKLVRADGTINYGDTVKQWGMNLQRIVTPHGSFFFKSHPLMTQNARYTNTIAIIDPPGLKYRYTEGRDTHTQDNIQANDADTMKGQWFTEAGCEFHHLKTMKIITNITI